MAGGGCLTGEGAATVRLGVAAGLRERLGVEGLLRPGVRVLRTVPRAATSVGCPYMSHGSGQ